MFPGGQVAITGASSGIGAAYAERAAAAGHDLLLIARRSDRLAQLSDRLAERYRINAETMVADLADPASLAAVELRLLERPVSALVNNAGTGALGPTANSTSDAQEALIRLNVIALVRLSLAALTGFRAKDAGALVNIGSIAGFMASVNTASYTGSKAFVMNFSRSLQIEYAGSGIRIQIVVPGPIRTEFLTAQGMDDSYFPDSSFITAEQLVDAAMAGLAAGEEITIPTLCDTRLWANEESARNALVKNTMGGAIGERYLG